MKRARPASGATTAVIGAVVLALVLGVALFAGRETSKTRITVDLSSGVALYPRDEVRVLGVAVGNIVSMRPTPTGVRAELEYDSAIKVPVTARAAVVSPSLVSVRFIQLTPVYRGGPILRSGSVIPANRTATPLEFDQLKKELNKVAADLGPPGADRTGAVANALNVASANLDGQGATLKSTITQMSAAANTFSGGAPDLFATVGNLNNFVTALNTNDAQVRAFTGQLSQFSTVLADNRHRLGQTLDNLDTAVAKVGEFVDQNRGELKSNVKVLQQLTGSLAEKRQSLATLIQDVPQAAGNFFRIYDPATGALTGALSDPFLASPAQLVCGSIFSVGGSPKQCAAALSPLADLVRQYHLPVLGGPPLGVGEPTPGSPLSGPSVPSIPLLGSSGRGN